MKVVLSYLVCGVAKPDAQPQVLSNLGVSVFRTDVNGLFVDNEARIWAAGGGAVHVFSSEGELRFTVASASPGVMRFPLGVAFDTDTSSSTSTGSAFISDFGDDCICEVRLSDGVFLNKFGKRGKGPCEFYNPQGMACDSEKGLVFIAEFGNSRIHVVKRDGSFVRVCGQSGSADGELSQPRGLCLSAAGELAVCDHSNGRIQVPIGCALFV